MIKEYKEKFIKDYNPSCNKQHFKEYFSYASGLASNIEGSFVEAGFGHGDSANIFVDLMNEGSIKKRNIWLFDSFEGFPKPSKEDLSKTRPTREGEWKVPIEPALEIKNKIDTEVEVVKGFFENTIPDSYGDEQIAILHLDCDLYDSYKVCLEGLYERVAPGGIILLDEYKSVVQRMNFPGASKAIDEFFKEINVQFTRFKPNPNDIRKELLSEDNLNKGEIVFAGQNVKFIIDAPKTCLFEKYFTVKPN